MTSKSIMGKLKTAIEKELSSAKMNNGHFATPHPPLRVQRGRP